MLCKYIQSVNNIFCKYSDQYDILLNRHQLTTLSLKVAVEIEKKNIAISVTTCILHTSGLFNQIGVIKKRHIFQRKGGKDLN